MARNRKVFEEAMQAGANAAWAKNWDQAIAAYQRALDEIPDDVGVLTDLGFAYTGKGQLEAALESYQLASEIAPDDPVLYERIGKIREQLGHRKEAAEAYLASADRYISEQQAPQLALQRWQDAIQAYPNCLKAHAQLLQYHHRHGHTRETVNECLALARIYQAQGQKGHAVQICQYALKLAPHDPDVLAALEDLRSGAQVAATPDGIPQERTESLAVAARSDSPDMLDFPVIPTAEVAKKRGSPVEITRQKALADLAESFFEEEEVAAGSATSRLSKAELDALISRAIDFQTRGKTKEAIATYKRIIQAEVHEQKSALHFNLGLLYQEEMRFDAAISQFEHAASEAEYALGSHFALGECYRAQGRIEKALEQFIKVLKTVDLAAVQREQADDLVQLYKNLVGSYTGQGDDEQALQFTNSLVDFLSQKDWEQKVVEARRRLDALAQEGPVLSLAEMLAIPKSEQVLESISLAQEYANRDMPYAALEECYYALALAPTYLPIHQQLAHVLVALDKVNEAVNKSVVIADTYWMRDNTRSAITMYQYALKLAPMATRVRAKLIDLLISQGKVDKALEHYLDMADSYYHMAQMDQAQETYQEALELARRGSPERKWAVRILHKIGDIYMQRVDWKRAIGIYEQIRKAAPNDERARLTLMDLYYRFNRPEQATAELDGLLEIYLENGKTQHVFDILEDAVREKPNEIPLRTRLAQVHLDAGNAEQALEHLDKLGDLQLEAGRFEDAKATIRAIIALQPPNVAAYQQLLDQIGERGSN